MNLAQSYSVSLERRRFLLSMSLSIGFYAILLGFGALLGILIPLTKTMKTPDNIPLIVDIQGGGPGSPFAGGSSGINSGNIANAAPSASSANDVAVNAMGEQKPQVKSTDMAKVVKPAAVEPAIQPKTAQKAPVTVVKPDNSYLASALTTKAPSQNAPVDVQATTTTTEQPWIPGPRAPGSRVSSVSSSVFVPGQGNVQVSPNSEASAGGSAGTSLSGYGAGGGGGGFGSSFGIGTGSGGGGGGVVGQNIRVPFYYSLPLPQDVPASFFDRIPDLVATQAGVVETSQSRQRTFLSLYRYEGSEYRLKSGGKEDQYLRDKVWKILDDSGYDLTRDNYTRGRSFLPVVIQYMVTKDKQLKNVQIAQSSGDPEIDQGVMNGFMRSSFWNKSGETNIGQITFHF
jgi:hypothetical protein